MLLQKTRLLGYHSHLYLHVVHANCLVQHLFFFSPCHYQKPLYNQSEKTQFSQMTCGCQAIVDQSIGLCD